MPPSTHWRALMLLLAATALTGALGAVASASDFYAALNRPSWAPPAGVFGPVWTVLYLNMALAAWLVVRASGWRQARGVMALFFAQLLVNGPLAGRC